MRVFVGACWQGVRGGIEVNQQGESRRNKQQHLSPCAHQGAAISLAPLVGSLLYVRSISCFH